MIDCDNNYGYPCIECLTQIVDQKVNFYYNFYYFSHQTTWILRTLKAMVLQVHFLVYLSMC